MSQSNSQNGPKILVVDDEAAVARILISLLEKRGYSVTVASSVAQAIDVLERTKFDVGIFDWKLMDGNGLDLAATLRGKGDETPIIFVTGFANNDLALSAAQLGIHDIISKPFSSEELYGALQRILPNFTPTNSAHTRFTKAGTGEPQHAENEAPSRRGLSPIFYFFVLILLLVIGALATLLLFKL